MIEDRFSFLQIVSQSSEEKSVRDEAPVVEQKEEVMWDPLSAFAGESAPEIDDNVLDDKDRIMDTWASKKAGILSR